MNCSRNFIVIYLLSLFSLSANAEEVYIGVGIGKATADVIKDLDAINRFGNQNIINPDYDRYSIDDEDNARKLFIGYEINNNFAIEGGLMDMGSILNLNVYASTADRTIDDVPFPVEVNATSSVEGAYLSAIGSISVLDWLSLKGKMGMYMWESDSTIDIITRNDSWVPGAESGTIKNNGADSFYGLGVNIAFVNLEYEVYDINGDDINYLGASVYFRF